MQTSLKTVLILIFAILLGSCHPSNLNNKETAWSVKLANAVMQRNDSLVIYNNPNSIAWRYDIAMLGQAINKISDDNDRYFNYHKNYLDLFLSNTGIISTYKLSEFNIDNVNPAKGLITLFQKTGDTKYRLAIETIMEQIRLQPQTADGYYIHKAIYDNQVWLNSTYMLAPFLAQYASTFNQPEWYEVACRQLIYTYNLTLDTKDGLLFHAWDATRQQNWANPQTGTSPNKWSRAMGYYMMALVDVLEFLPEEHPNREEICSILKSTSKAILDVKDNTTDLWFQLVNEGNKEFNYIETSGSAMFIYAFAKGTHLGILPSKYADQAKQSFGQLVGHYIITDADKIPTLTHISGSAGLGYKKQRDGTFEYYINQKRVDNDPRGMAALIMAAVELNL